MHICHFLSWSIFQINSKDNMIVFFKIKMLGFSFPQNSAEILNMEPTFLRGTGEELVAGDGGWTISFLPTTCCDRDTPLPKTWPFPAIVLHFWQGCGIYLRFLSVISVSHSLLFCKCISAQQYAHFSCVFVRPYYISAEMFVSFSALNSSWVHLESLKGKQTEPIISCPILTTQLLESRFILQIIKS